MGKIPLLTIATLYLYRVQFLKNIKISQGKIK